MAPRKKIEGGIVKLIGKPIQFIDCRNETAGHGILLGIDQHGFVEIEKDESIIFLHINKIDAITEIKE